MNFKLYDYECPYCHLTSYSTVLISMSNFGFAIPSNGHDSSASMGSSYLMCPFCKKIFFRDQGECYKKSESFLEAKEIGKSLKKKNVSSEENLKRFFTVHVDKKLLKKYAEDVINCFPKRHAKQVASLCHYKDFEHENKGFFSDIYQRFRSRIVLWLRIRKCRRATHYKPSGYSRKESNLFGSLLAIIRKERISVDAIDDGIEFLATAFRQCKKDDILRYVVVLRFIWEMECKSISKKEKDKYIIEYRAALEEFVNIPVRYDGDLVQDALLKAEFCRRLKRFEEAEEILEDTYFNDEEYREMAEAMMDRIRRKDPNLFWLAAPQ